MRKNVFISYSSKESSTAHMISDVLEKNGISCWIAPECIAPGLDYSEEIPRGIEGCDVFLLLLSESSQASVWVKNELLTAVSAGKVVIPFVISKCDITKAFQFALTSTQRWDAYEAMSDNLEKLVKQVKGIAGLPEEIERDVAEAEDRDAVEAVAEPGNVDEQPEEVEEIEVCEETSETVEKEDEEEAETEVVKSFRNLLYTDDGENVTIVGCKEGAKKLTIPEEIKGMPVERIGAHAFDGNVDLVTIKLSENVEEIEGSAFKDCVSLSEVTGIDRACEIAADAFEGCVKLKKNPLQREEWEKYFEIEESEEGITIFKCINDAEEIVIPEQIHGKPVTEIFGGAFAECTSLAEVNIPEGVTEIRAYTFLECKNLAKINIPEGVTEICRGAFAKCTSLAEVNIPEGVTEIGEYEFQFCTSLAKINIPEGVTEIGECAFQRCTSLAKINIPEGVTEICRGAFAECTSLAEINIPESVTEIGNCAFQFCTSLAEINIPEGVTVLSHSLFAGCEKLKRILIPRNVKFIASAAFLGCESLIHIKYSGENEFIPRDADAWNKLNIKEEQEKINQIPEGKMMILSDAFEGCSALAPEKLDDVACEMIAIGGCEEARARVLDKYLEYARMYSEGAGVEKDEKEASVWYQKAAEWYQKAAENGNADAQYIVAGMYMEGKFLEKDVEKAVSFYRCAALENHTKAQYELIGLFLEGTAVGVDKEKLGEMYCNVIEDMMLSIALQIRIAVLKKEKSGGRLEDIDSWNQKAADNGNAYAQYEMGCYWESNNDLSKAIMWYEKAAEQGRADAQRRLAFLYEKEGEIRNAVRWYEKSLEFEAKKEQILLQSGVEKEKLEGKQSEGSGRLHLAELYLVLKDWKNVVRHYTVMANKNEVSAQYGLAMCYMTGRGVEQDYGMACELFRKAAEQGHAVACLMLGMLYGTGKGVVRNDEEAKRWYEKSGEKKN